MGGLMSYFRGLFGNKEMRILILGLDGAGKTTLLYRLQVRINENFLRDSERVKDFFTEQVEVGLLFVIDLTNDILVRLFISTFEQSTSLL